MRARAALAAALVGAAALAAGSEGDALVGTWKPDDREVVVGLTRVGAGFSAAAPAPDGGSVELFRGVVWDAASKTWKGELYAPKRKEWLGAVLRLEGADTLVLEVGSGFFGKKLTWRRTSR
jgi:uncharacterized protein (DUF2147 family)